MLHLNKDINVVRQFLEEADIREILSKQIVGNIVNGQEILPTKMFVMIAPKEKNSEEMELVTLIAQSSTLLINKTYSDGSCEKEELRTYYTESMVEQILNIVEQRGGILSLC